MKNKQRSKKRRKSNMKGGDTKSEIRENIRENIKNINTDFFSEKKIKEIKTELIGFEDKILTIITDLKIPNDVIQKAKQEIDAKAAVEVLKQKEKEAETKKVAEVKAKSAVAEAESAVAEAESAVAKAESVLTVATEEQLKLVVDNKKNKVKNRLLNKTSNLKKIMDTANAKVKSANDEVSKAKAKVDKAKKLVDEKKAKLKEANAAAIKATEEFETAAAKLDLPPHRPLPPPPEAEPVADPTSPPPPPVPEPTPPPVAEPTPPPPSPSPTPPPEAVSATSAASTKMPIDDNIFQSFVKGITPVIVEMPIITESSTKTDGVTAIDSTVKKTDSELSSGIGAVSSGIRSGLGTVSSGIVSGLGASASGLGAVSSGIVSGLGAGAYGLGQILSSSVPTVSTSNPAATSKIEINDDIFQSFVKGITPVIDEMPINKESSTISNMLNTGFGTAQQTGYRLGDGIAYGLNTGASGVGTVSSGIAYGLGALGAGVYGVGAGAYGLGAGAYGLGADAYGLGKRLINLPHIISPKKVKTEPVSTTLLEKDFLIIPKIANLNKLLISNNFTVFKNLKGILKNETEADRDAPKKDEPEEREPEERESEEREPEEREREKREREEREKREREEREKKERKKTDEMRKQKDAKREAPNRKNLRDNIKTDEDSRYKDDQEQEDGLKTLESESNIFSTTDEERKLMLVKLGIMDPKNPNQFYNLMLQTPGLNNVISTLPNGFTPHVFFNRFFNETKELTYPILSTVFPSTAKDVDPPPLKREDKVLNLTVKVSQPGSILHDNEDGDTGKSLELKVKTPMLEVNPPELIDTTIKSITKEELNRNKAIFKDIRTSENIQQVYNGLKELKVFVNDEIEVSKQCQGAESVVKQNYFACQAERDNTENTIIVVPDDAPGLINNQFHKIITIKDFSWQWFNVLTFGYIKTDDKFSTTKESLEEALNKLQDLKKFANSKFNNYELYVEPYSLEKKTPSYYSFHMHAINLDKANTSSQKQKIIELIQKTLRLDDVIDKITLEHSAAPTSIKPSPSFKELDLIEDILDLHMQNKDKGEQEVEEEEEEEVEEEEEEVEEEEEEEEEEVEVKEEEKNVITLVKKLDLIEDILDLHMQKKKTDKEVKPELKLTDEPKLELTDELKLEIKEDALMLYLEKNKVKNAIILAEEMNEYKYTIFAHGGMMYKYKDNVFGKKKLFYSFIIPKNVEIYVFVPVGEVLMACSSSLESICGYTKKERDSRNHYLLDSAQNIPRFKYQYTEGKENKFPNIFLTKDPTRTWNSGIVYCQNPEERKRVIYNIDADPDQQCNNSSIFSIKNKYNTQYNSDKNYTEWYNKKLLEPNPICGCIALSEAIKLIQEHNESLPKSEKNLSNKIKIFVHSCLSEYHVDWVSDQVEKEYVKQNYRIPSLFVTDLTKLEHTELKTSNKLIYTIIINKTNYIFIVNKEQQIYHRDIEHDNNKYHNDYYDLYLQDKPYSERYYFGYTAKRDYIDKIIKPNFIDKIIKPNKYKNWSNLPNSVYIDLTEQNITKYNKELYDSIERQILAALQPGYKPTKLWEDTELKI